MKNREFYKEEILQSMTKSGDFCGEFIEPKILASYGLECCNTNCKYCEILTQVWLEEEYKEPEVDWTKVEVDTPILVSDDKENWVEAHFAKYKDETIYAWFEGTTSWTATGETSWKYAKLAEKE